MNQKQKILDFKFYNQIGCNISIFDQRGSKLYDAY